MKVHETITSAITSTITITSPVFFYAKTFESTITIAILVEKETVYIQAKEGIFDGNRDGDGDVADDGEARAEDDDDLDDWDDDPELRSIREKRLAEMKKQFSETQKKLSRGHGDYRIVSEQV